MPLTDALATAILGIYLCTFTVGVLLPRLPNKLRVELFVFSCLPTGLVALYYLHLVDHVPLYYSLRSVPYIELSSGVLGLGVGMVARELHARNKRLVIMVVVPVMAAVSLLPYAKNLVAPLDTAALHDRWDGPYCLQSADRTCGPACLATFLSLAGRKESEADISRNCLTTSSGTEVWYLARYARQRGLKADFFQLPPGELKGKRGIIGVKLGAGARGHFIALLDCDGEKVEYVDPISGRKSVPMDLFRKNYEYTGFLMALE